jgi:hypothetical protein
MEHTRREILIVANETACGEDLLRTVGVLMDERATRFTLVVPATPPRGTLTWTESEAATLAGWRLAEALEAFRAIGAEADGRAGDARPFDAVSDAMGERPFDAIIVSTLASGVSRWLPQGLPGRIQRTFQVPVIHVVSERDGMRDPFVRLMMQPELR